MIRNICWIEGRGVPSQVGSSIALHCCSFAATDTGVKGRTQFNLAVSSVCHHCHDCVKKAVCGDLNHNNVILLPHF